MRRALTLLELLIVLALLAALSVVVVPAVQGTLAERSFDAAADRVLDQLRFARNHARTNDRTVVVLYRGGSSVLELREFGANPDALGVLADPAGMNEMASASDLLRDGDPAVVDEEEHGTIVLAAYARYALPGALVLQRTRPEFLEDPLWLEARGVDDMAGPDTFAPPEFEDVEFDDPFTDPRDAEALIRLAVFLPDGQALLTQSVWLVDGAERAGEITIDAFTGAPSFTRAEVVLADAARDDDDDALEDDAIDDPNADLADPPASDDAVPADSSDDSTDDEDAGA